MAAEQTLAERFPSMKPIKSPPSLYTMNGIGFGLWGQRDYDRETQTYVATWCFVVLFIPVLCLRGYRVAKAQPSGWYFLGREPLGRVAKGWNLALLLGILGVIGAVQYSSYTSSPEYIAKQKMIAAAKQVDAGHLGAAAQTYASLALMNTPEADHANVALRELLDGPCQQAPLVESAQVYPHAVSTSRRGGSSAMQTGEVASKAVKLVAAKGDAAPKAGVAILDAVRPLVIDTTAIDDRRLALLKKWAAAEPTNLEVVVPLASALEKQDDVAAAKALLMPVKADLGDGEGARVLGLILGREGDYDGAYALLWPNVKSRLDRLRAAESAAESASQRIWDREIDRLDKGQGPESFYTRYKSSAKPQQEEMVQEYIGNKIRTDPEYLATQEALGREVGVVSDALELGIVMLQRAQTQANAAERTKQLKAAEETFLAIHGFAGETDAYRITLGQVYYWLGREKDGKKLFDDYLASKNRAAENLMQIASRLRQLGSDGDVRALSEEAYKKATKPEQKFEAALTRSIVSTDNDDRIAWLNRSNLTNPSVKATLARAVGDKAFGEGRDEEAVSQYQQALAAYDAMPRNEHTLNELTLTHYSIFGVTGDPQAFSRCLDCFQQAVDRDPSDAILLFNAGSTLLSGAAADVIGQSIDLRALRESGDLSLLNYLYQDEAGRAALAKRVAAHPGVARAQGYLDKLLVLSPKSLRTYTTVYSVHHFTRNEPALRALLDRVKAAGPDTAEELSDRLDYIKGTRDAQNVKSMAAALQRAEALLPAARAKGGATAAIALTNHAERLLALRSFGQPADLARAVALADEAHAAAPSSQTWRGVAASRLARAYDELCKSDPALASFCKPYERSLGSTYLMTYLASEAGHREKALKHADVKAAVGLLQAQLKVYPQGLGAFDWALLSVAAPEDAARVAAVVRSATRLPTIHAIDQALRPSSAAEALDAYWFAKTTGNPKLPKDALSRVAAMGVPVPPVK